MKLTAAGLACLRSQGVYIIEKCNGCGKLPNQTFRQKIAGKLRGARHINIHADEHPKIPKWI